MSLPLLLQPGTQIGGQYIVNTLINSGGFGAVYRGYDTGENNRLCAIKETYDVSPAARRRALREVGILLAIKNQHLPEVYDAFEDNGRFYVVMQLIEGQNLLQMLHAHRAPFSEREVLGWLLPVMDVLQELHTRPTPVIHRDIKPANIIIAPNQCAVLVDFGLTKLYSPEDTTRTIERAVSLGFSPIEQYIGTTSPQSDIYSLAATMYMLLTNGTPASSMQRSYHDELIAPRLLNPAISPPVEHALLRGLALKPEDRFQSMQAFALSLRGSTPRAYNDRTIAAPGMLGVSPPSNKQYIESAHIPSPAQPANYGRHQAASKLPVNGTAQGSSRSGSGARNGKSGSSIKNAPQYPNSHPVTPQQEKRLPAGKGMASKRPLPGAFNQGCLWGMLQGVLAALIVLLLRKEADFYVAIATGFVFYFIAGTLTTHKGSKSSRGAWAGFWAGIISTIVFWLSLGVGLYILVVQRTLALQRLGSTPHPDIEFNYIWHLVMPVVYNHPIVQMRPGLVLTLFLTCGLLLATGFGWIGGRLAKADHRASKRAVRSI
ncbi:MAG: serine/threonine-protein kinase [Ktedonobacteraceae bacterium]